MVGGTNHDIHGDHLVSIRYTHNDLHLTSSFVKEYEIGSKQMGVQHILPTKTLLICKPCESYPKGEGTMMKREYHTLPMMLIDHEA